MDDNLGKGQGRWCWYGLDLGLHGHPRATLTHFDKNTNRYTEKGLHQGSTDTLTGPHPLSRRSLIRCFFAIGDKLLHESLANDNRFKNKSKSSNFPEIEQVMLAVMEEAEKQKMTLTSGYIRNMALELAKQLGIENFNASQGWLQVQKSVNRLKPNKNRFSGYQMILSLKLI